MGYSAFPPPSERAAKTGGLPQKERYRDTMYEDLAIPSRIIDLRCGLAISDLFISRILGTIAHVSLSVRDWWTNALI